MTLMLVTALTTAACGSSDSGPGRITVRLMDGPSVAYDAVNLHVREVQIHAEGGWLTLGAPDRVVDLLTLRNGVTTTLVTEKEIGAGHYTQMRLVLGPDSTIVLAGPGDVASRTRPLVVPSGQQSGVKLNVNFDVQPDTTADVVIDVDAARSVFVHRTGASEKYLLRPVVSAVDILLTGAIRGVLTDAASGAPLRGVQVTAQTVEGAAPVIVRGVITADDGSYLLPYLPAGGTYHVVSQPIALEAGAAKAYHAEASPPFLIVRESAVAIWDEAFDAALAGAVSGSVEPPRAETQVDTVSLAQALPVGADAPTFIVQTADAQLVDGAESYGFATVPVGAYTAWVTRRTTLGEDEVEERGVASDPFTVEAGVTTPVPLAVPSTVVP